MSDPIIFPSATTRFALPLLFAGQAQKEFFVNEAHALTDMLLHPVVEGEADSPPSEAAEGECWLVAEAASGEWQGQDGKLASYQSGGWLFADAADGMAVHDRSAGCSRYFRAGWRLPASVHAAEGGDTIDQPARDAIAGLIAALVTAGILPTEE